MDTADTSTAVNVIRMNRNGIGFSTNGYNGPFTTAWTIDGGFVADFIKSGTIEAIDITGSNITGSNLRSENGTYQMQMWAAVMTLLHDTYMRAVLYTASGAAEDSFGILKLFSGTTTDANVNPSDGYVQILNHQGTQVINGADTTGGFQLHENNGTVYLSDNRGHMVVLSANRLGLINSNTNTSINLSDNDGLSIYINGSGYTNIGFVSDGQGHVVLGV